MPNLQGSNRVLLKRVTALCVLLAGCASAPVPVRRGNDRPPLEHNPVLRDATDLHACQAWRFPLHAHLSHLSLGSERLLVSTSSDHRHAGRLRLLATAGGKVLWLKNLRQPVKAQAITPDGTMAAISTYDGKLALYSTRSGIRLWEREHLGRPVLCPRTKRVVLLNDDDSEPNIAFVSYDYSGNKQGQLAVTSEPIDMDVADDESYVAVSTAERSLGMYSLAGEEIAKGRLEADTVAIEAVGGEQPMILAIATRPNARLAQTLEAYRPATRGSRELERAWKTDLDMRFESIQHREGAVFVYGNTHAGQALAAFETGTGKMLWKRSYSTPASYSSLMFTGLHSGKPFMTAALDEGTPAGTLHLLAASTEGKAIWDATISASNGLYSYSYSDEKKTLAVGAGEPGDGLVEFFRISASPCR